MNSKQLADHFHTLERMHLGFQVRKTSLLFTKQQEKTESSGLSPFHIECSRFVKQIHCSNGDIVILLANQVIYLDILRI